MPLLPGSIDTLTLTLETFGPDTLATVVVNAPDGSVLTPVAISNGDRSVWAAQPTYTVTGKHVALWTVLGVGAGEVAQEIWVSAVPDPATLLAWRPERWHVADYVPGRTLVGVADGYGNALNTFDDTTHPRGGTIDRLITSACAWVLARTGPLVADGSLNDMGRATAALWAAATVENTYPDTSRDPQIAATLLAQANAMRDDLWHANVAATGTDVEDPATHLMPEFSFPAAVPWGDTEFD